MSDKFFLDTNVFVYSFDETARHKAKKAHQLIEDALKKREGVTSYQVVQEFLNVATRKFKVPMSESEAQLYLKEVLWPLCVMLPSFDLYQHALYLKEKHKLSFYDSIIVASAIQADCKKLYTEDLHSGQVIEGVVVENPF